MSGGKPHEISGLVHSGVADAAPMVPPRPGCGRRPAAEGLSLEYGNARWNKQKIAGEVRKLVDRNVSHGGGLRIWCAEFGCYQRTIDPESRYRYLKDVRETFEENRIGWAYWSYNETLTIMTPSRTPFGPAKEQTPDPKTLEALFAPRPQ